MKSDFVNGKSLRQCQLLPAVIRSLLLGHKGLYVVFLKISSTCVVLDLRKVRSKEVSKTNPKMTFHGV